MRESGVLNIVVLGLSKRQGHPPSEGATVQWEDLDDGFGLGFGTEAYRSC